MNHPCDHPSTVPPVEISPGRRNFFSKLGQVSRVSVSIPHRRIEDSYIYLNHGSRDVRFLGDEEEERAAPTSVRDLSSRCLLRNPVSFRFVGRTRTRILSLSRFRPRRNIFRNGSYPELPLSVPAFCPAKQNWARRGRDYTVFTLERFSLRFKKGGRGKDKSCLGRKGGKFPRFFS